jgi:hypothetical protein
MLQPNGKYKDAANFGDDASRVRLSYLEKAFGAGESGKNIRQYLYGVK